MGLNTIIEIFLKYSSMHAINFFRTLTKPHDLIFLSVADKEKNNVNITDKRNINPQLLVFVAINIFIGFCLDFVIREDGITIDFQYSLIGIFVSWVVFSMLLHLVVKILRGKGSFVDTISTSLQIQSVLYVISLLLTLGFKVVAYLYEAIIQNYFSIHFFSRYDEGLSYFIILEILMLVYLPISLKRVHELGWIKIIPLLLVIPIFILFSFGLLLSSGIRCG